MSSAISAIGSSAVYQGQNVTARPGSSPVHKQDNDGDQDGSKAGETERPARPSSATIGNTINTTA